jgi:hypothetical protein
MPKTKGAPALQREAPSKANLYSRKVQTKHTASRPKRQRADEINADNIVILSTFRSARAAAPAQNLKEIV